MKNVIVSLVALAGIAGAASAQTQLPVGATLRYEVSVGGGAWSSNATINAGERVEWRAVVSYTGSNAAVALGRIFYQPVLSNTDNSGPNTDSLGAWRNNGVSGQGNTTLAQGLLTNAEGADANSLPSYGRVRFGFTSRSTTAGSSGGLVGIAHSGGSAGAPAGDYIRIAASNNPNWYPATIPSGSVALNNQILWGVVSDNSAATSSWFSAGTQNVVLFRQAFIASTDTSLTDRVVSLTSEASTLFRAGGAAGTDDTRFMTWALAGEGGSTATERVGVAYEAATITIRAVPAPGAVALLGLGGLIAGRRRRA